MRSVNWPDRVRSIGYRPVGGANRAHRLANTASNTNWGNDVRTRLAAMLAAVAMTAAGLAGAAPAAHADTAGQGRVAAAPVLTRVDLDYGYDGTVRGGLIYFNEPVASSTQLNITVAACGRVLHTETVTGVVQVPNSTGGVEYAQAFRKTIDKSMAGPSIEVSVSFSDPAIPPTSTTGYTHNGYPRSCDNLEPADDNGGGSVTVKAWSVKKGATTTAKVGKSLGITPTRAPGAKVTYAWKVGAKIVDRDRVFFVKKTYKGKKVTVRINVSKPGAKSMSRVLRYGTAR